MLALVVALSTGANQTANAASGGTDFYAGATAGTADNWNSAASGAKWTADAGATYADAEEGNTYHTNGYTIRPGRMGQPLGGTTGDGTVPSSTFAGQTLVIDGFSSVSGLTDASAGFGGRLLFELANPSATSTPLEMPVGPRLTAEGGFVFTDPTMITKGRFIANIVTAATPVWGQARDIRGRTGVFIFDGTLVLNGHTTFTLPSGPNDMLFQFNGPVTGTGNIQLSGGTAGGLTSNGWVTWAFKDLTGWTGTTISVYHKHTISFAGNHDFFTTNPNLELSFSRDALTGSYGTLGFLNLQGDVSFASGRVTYMTGTTAAPISNTIPDGVYTAASLNAVMNTGTGGYGTQPFASGGPNFNTADTNYKIWIGQPIPATVPVITLQPVSQTWVSGGYVTFTVAASGNPAPSYQWRKDGMEISGATGTSLTLTNVTMADFGTYTVVVRNPAGSVTSNPAVLVTGFPWPPTIITHPASQTVTVGSNVTFTVVATGSPAPTYQWKQDDIDITGATGTTLSLSNVSSASAGSYTVVVSNSSGSVSSAVATLTVDPLPTGMHFHANAAATGSDGWNSATAGTKWTTGAGQPYIAASADNSYHTNGYTIRAGQIGVLSNAGQPGYSIFNGAQLVVDSFDPASGLTDASMGGGGILYFELASSPVGPRTTPSAFHRAYYVADILTAATPAAEIRTIRISTGETTIDGTLTLNGKTVFSIPGGVNDARAHIKAPVTGAGNIELSGGTAGSQTPNGHVTWAFEDLTRWQGTRIDVLHRHTISFTGPADFYTTNPAAALAFSSTSLGFLNLQADVSFASGKVTYTTGTTSAPVTRVIPDGIYTAGQLNALLASDYSTGTGYFNQPLASGGPNFDTADTTHWLFIGQPTGSPSSIPVIITHPVSQTVYAGAPASLAVVAAGGPTMSYQWKRDGVELSGETGATLTIGNVGAGDAGSYTVTVSNATGSVTGKIAILTVKVGPDIWVDPLSSTVNSGSNASFIAYVTGAAPFSYQWLKEGVAIPGATGKTLALNNVVPADSGGYAVRVSDAGGSTTSGTVTLTVTILPPGVNYFASNNAGNADNWNTANRGYKWTADGSLSDVDAGPDAICHTNGYTVRVGRIGSPIGGAAGDGIVPVSLFAGQTLVIDGFNTASDLTNSSAGFGGRLLFELADPSATSGTLAMPVGPRLTAEGGLTFTEPTAVTKARFVANIVTAATPGPEIREIRGRTGITILDGTLLLNGNTLFTLPTGPNDVLFRINAPVTGSGNIQISGGSAGGLWVNGWVTWEFANMTGWTGMRIDVMHKQTISFTGNADFFTLNPSASLNFSSTTVGYLNLQADVSFGSGKVTYTTGTSSSPVTHIIPDGAYTAAQLNALLASDPSSNNGYVTQRFASDGPGFSTTGSTFRLYIGQAIPAAVPAITTQPASRMVYEGGEAIFTVEATGQPVPAYQWQRDGADIPGATRAQLVVSNAQAGDGGSYAVVVSNTNGSVTSDAAILTVTLGPPPPVITTQPVSRTAYVGNSTIFTVEAAGTVAPAYQWKKDGVDIPGATTASLMISNVQFSHAGSYTVAVSNPAGSVTSAVAVLAVPAVVPPGIVTQPAGKTVTVGGSASLTVTASGTAPLAYQWKKGGIVVAGATAATLSLGNVTQADAGGYSVVVSNSGGSATSAIATLTVNMLPAGTDFYAGATAGSNDNWISANVGVKWTADYGGTYVNAAAGHTYHTNGYAIRVGRIGSPVGGAAGDGTVPVSSFADRTLVIDGYSYSSGLTVTTGLGSVYFELADPTGTKLPVGPRGTAAGTYVNYGKDAVTKGNFVANIVTAPTTGTGFRQITGGTGVISLDGTLQLNGTTRFALNSGPNDMLFDIKAPVTGSGNIQILGGSGGGQTVNGWVTWRFHDLSGWSGRRIDVMHKHTISFASKNDFYTTNPDLELCFNRDVTTGGPTVIGFLNLQADVSFGSGKVTYMAGTTAAPFLKSIPDGAYTVAELNLILAAGGYWAQSFASGGPDFNPAYRNCRIYIGQPVPPPEPVITTEPLALTVAVGTYQAAGYVHSLYVRADGTLWAMGGNGFGQLGDGTTSDRSAPVQVAGDVAAVAAGTYHSLFVKNDGTLWAMGHNEHGQLGDGTTSDRFAPVQVADEVAAVAAGAYHSLFVKRDGTLWAMGGNYSGQLGEGTNISQSVPVQVADEVVAAAAGGGHSLYVRADGTLWSMGANGLGQLGDGTAVSRSVPLQVASRVVTVATGSSLSLFVKADGTLWAMGYNQYGQLGVGTTMQRLTPVMVASDVAAVAGGTFHSLFVKRDGTLWAMGDNSSGQLGDGTAVNRLTPVQVSDEVAAAVAGAYHSLFVKRDGTLWAMGENLHGQLGDGSVSSRRLPVLIDNGIATGSMVMLTVMARGEGQLSYQWKKDGKDISGATASVMAMQASEFANISSYTVAVTNAWGSATSAPAALTVTALSRLANLSVRSNAGVDSQSLIVGFVTGGQPANASLLVRAAGPALSSYGVSGALADPKLAIHDVSAQIQSNDDWTPLLASTFAQIGAFPWVLGSKDAAIELDLSPAPYTAVVTGDGDATGVALAEIYDSNMDFGPTSPQLVNVSARSQVGTGENILIAGFVITGGNPQRVLIRAVGPTLVNYGVAGLLADPQLAVFQGQELIDSNDDWDPQLAPTFEQVGAFPLPSGSKDSAVLVTLAPGVYTAQVTGTGGTTGVALVEVYAVP